MITCIIPYFNEAQRVDRVIESILHMDLIEEIILVDDGSTDGGYAGTAPHVHHYHLPLNQGKCEAMRFGLKKANGEIIVFLDADLTGLTSAHVESLVSPLLQKQSDLVVSRRELISYFDVVSGERAFYKSDWENFFLHSKHTGNAMEIAMNQSAIERNMRMHWVKWEGVSQVYKSQKSSIAVGMWHDIKHVKDWINQLGYFRFGCVYLLSWMMVANKAPALTAQYHKLVNKMF